MLAACCLAHSPYSEAVPIDVSIQLWAGQIQRVMCKPITQLRLKYVSTTDLTPDPAETPLAFETGSGLKGGGPVWAIPLQIDHWRDVLSIDTATHTISYAFAIAGRSAVLPR